MTDLPTVYAIVLAWNQLDLTIECLASLQKSKYPNLHLLLVDNGSTDGTTDHINHQFPSVRIVRSKENLGVSGGYNLGLQNAVIEDPEYLIVLNNDTITHPNMINELVAAAKRYPNAGILMPKIYQFPLDSNKLWYAGARWRRFPPGVKTIGLNSFDNEKFRYDLLLEYASGCCMLFPRSTLSVVGLFDPIFKFYFEDWDISERVRKAGYQIYFIADAHIWHKVSSTTKRSIPERQVLKLMGSGSAMFYCKHKSKTILWLNTFWVMIRELFHGSIGNPLAYLSGVVDYFGKCDH